MIRGGSRTAVVGCVAAALLCACRAPAPPPKAPTTTPSPAPEPPPEMLRPRGTAFRSPGPYRPSSVTAAVPGYSLAADLHQVANLKQFAFLNDSQRALLGRQHFVVTPAADAAPEGVYERNIAARLPSILTTDMALLAFDRVARRTWRRLEAESLPALLTALTLSLVERSAEQYRAAPSAELKDAARANLAYLAVAARLLGLAAEDETGAGRQAAAELARLDTGQIRSAIFPYAFPAEIPALTEAADRPARARAALAWYTAAPFATRYRNARGDPVEAWGVVRQMLLLSHALGTPPEEPLRQWETVADTRRFLLGATAELDVADLLATAEEVYGPRRTLRDYDDFQRLRQFATALSQRVRPSLGAAGLGPELPYPERFRLFGAPHRPDRDLLVELSDPLRRVAGGLDLFAALGHPRAAELLEHTYRVPATTPRYDTALERVRAYFEALEPDTWRADLYLGRLWACAALAGPTAGHPQFQQAPAWADRTLLATLAAWATLRHEDSLGPPPPPALAPEPRRDPQPPVGYVEPAPELYNRLAYLAAGMTAGLQVLGLLTDDLAAEQLALAELLTFCRTAAERELRNESLTLAERQWLFGFDRILGALLESAGEAVPVAGVAEAAVLGTARLEIGVGPVQVLDVIVPDSGKFYLARGAVLSYHEQARPLESRWSDAEWQQLLVSGSAPGQPEWAASFVVPNRSQPHLPAATAPLPTTP